jgi:hypothetical protein
LFKLKEIRDQKMFNTLFFVFCIFNFVQISTSSTFYKPSISSSFSENFPRLLFKNTTFKTLKMTANSYFSPDGKEIRTYHNFNLNTFVKNVAENCREYHKENCFADVENLDLSENRLTEFPMNLTKLIFKNIKCLNVSNNAIKTLLPHKDFTSMLARNTLHTLDLSFNQISTIDEEAFKHLKSLKYLNLANNRIKFINLFAFSADTHHLVELDLSRNLIVDTSMEFLLFSSLTKLIYLNLNQNRLTTLSNHLLYNLYDLQYLSLSRNNLKTFDLFSLNTKNNEYLKELDLSFNFNLKLDYDQTKNVQQNEENNEEDDDDDAFLVNNIKVLNIAGVDLTYSNVNIFLNNLFEQFTHLEILNLSSTKVKSLWSPRWPRSIEIIDASNNYIEQLDCIQFESNNNETLNLKTILLKSNRFSDFKSFMNSCSNIFKHYNGLTIDLTSNLFEKIESIKTISKCQRHQNLNGLILNKNPLVCDCDENTWWSSIDETNSISPTDLFEFNENVCFEIKDYEKLSCSSVSESKLELLNEDSNYDERYLTSKQAFTFGPIRNSRIAPILVCPYKYSCSTKTCECCGFRACDCSFHCPLSCKCTRDYAHTFDMVNCTNVNLNIIPSYLPMSTTEILLDNNNLKKIQPYQFFGRFRVRKIDLSLNQLAFVEENSFHGLTQLKILSLSYNHLQILLGYEFKDLYLLEELHLDHNRIQFISNLTFSSLLNLKHVSLQHNSLRHLVEREFYFQFNLNLQNLTLDSSFHATETESNQIKLIESLKNSNANKVQKSFKTKVENKTFLHEKKYNSSMTYFNLIKRILNTKSTSYLIECIFDKFKEIAEDQHDLSASDIVSLNLNTKTSDEYLKLTLLRHFKQLKTACNETLTGMPDINRLREQSASKMMSLSQAEIDQNLVEYDLNLDETKLKEDKDKNTMFFRIKSSLIVLNYSTIFWCILILVLIILFFSLLFACCLIRFQQKKRQKKLGTKIDRKKSIFDSLHTKISKLLKRHKWSHSDEGEEEEKEEMSRSNSQRIYNKKQSKYLLDNPKLKFKSKNVNRLKINHPNALSDVNSNETSDSLRSSSIESSSTKIFDETSSEGYSFNRTTSGLFHSHIWEKDFFQLKTDSNLSTEEKPMYDLFLVYNKIDKDLVENMIGPVLQSRPYNYKIVFQHEHNKCHNFNSTTNQELITWNQMRSNYYNLNLIEQFVDLVNVSSFVLFVLSKNLFTELEYRLSIETPKHKKLVLLADDIHDSIAENLLQPGQIFKGNFNFNDHHRRMLSLDINDGVESKRTYKQEFTTKNTRLLKLSNSLSNQSSFHAYNKQNSQKYPPKS